MYASTAVRTPCKYLMMTYQRKQSRDPRVKKLAGDERLLKQSQHPNEGEIGRKSSLNKKWLAFSMIESMVNMRVDSWCR